MYQPSFGAISSEYLTAVHANGFIPYDALPTSTPTTRLKISAIHSQGGCKNCLAMRAIGSAASVNRASESVTTSRSASQACCNSCGSNHSQTLSWSMSCQLRASPRVAAAGMSRTSRELQNHIWLLLLDPGAAQPAPSGVGGPAAHDCHTSASRLPHDCHTIATRLPLIICT